MTNSNADKAEHGRNNQIIILGILDEFLKADLIEGYAHPFRYEDENANEFYAPFLLTFLTGEKWIIYTSTSFRSDRAKEWYWDIINIKKNKEFARAYFVYSDHLSPHNKRMFDNWKTKYFSGPSRKLFDNICSASEFRKLALQHATIGKGLGYINNAVGNMFEQAMANALQNPSNLQYLVAPKSSTAENAYEILQEVLLKTKINPVSVRRISASSQKKDIGYLPSGGQAKTDVLAKIEFIDGEDRTLTFSCKKSSADWVSVSQYSADTMADAIDSNNQELRDLLNKFQKDGTLSGMTEDDRNRLTDILRPLVKKLTLWALGGIDGCGDPLTQWARWIIISHGDDPDDFEVWSVEDYADRLIANSNGNFGTPFHWTYASGGKGKSIQLKAKII